MTGDFNLVRESARQTIAARTGRRAATVLMAAWSSAAVGRRGAAAHQAWRNAARPARIRWWAIAVATAAATHLVLRLLLSPTVAPAMPAAFYLAIAIAAVLIAWMADAVDRAWNDSRLSRSFR